MVMVGAATAGTDAARGVDAASNVFGTQVTVEATYWLYRQQVKTGGKEQWWTANF